MTAVRDRFDERRFPSLAAYLRPLPAGLASFPECQVKAVFVHSVLSDYPLQQASEQLPAGLAELLQHLPPSTAWISEVHFHALLRVLRDLYFATDAALVAWSYGSQYKLLGGPLYRVMFALLSPERVVRLAPQRWAHFHRGLWLEVTAASGRAMGTLHHPPYLYQRLDHELSLAGMRAVIELAGGRSVRTDIEDTSPTQSRSLLTWT